MGDEERGAAIRARRVALGMDRRPLAQLAKVDRATLAAVEEGRARETSFAMVEAALDKLEFEMGAPYDPRDALAVEKGLVTFELRGNFGVSATVKGPVQDVHVLREEVERLLDKMTRQSEDNGDAAEK